MFEKLKLKRKINSLKKQIAQNNDNDARYQLAMIYLDGSVLKRDEKQAFALLKTAADNGHLKSKAYLLSDKTASAFNIGVGALDNIINTFKD